MTPLTELPETLNPKRPQDSAGLVAQYIMCPWITRNAQVSEALSPAWPTWLSFESAHPLVATVLDAVCILGPRRNPVVAILQ